MNIFINDNRRNGSFMFNKKKGNGMQMAILSNLTDDAVKFKFDSKESIKGVYGDIEIHGLDITKDGSTFNCQKIKDYVHDNDKETIFVILNSKSIVPGDIFVTEDVKERINVLSTIERSDIEPDYGPYISKLYVASFDISKGEEITLYKGYGGVSCSPVEEMTFKWYESKQQFVCERLKARKPFVKNLVSLSAI